MSRTFRVAILIIALVAAGFLAWQMVDGERPEDSVLISRARLEVIRLSNGEAGDEYGQRLSDLGVALWNADRRKDAIPYFEEATRVMEQSLGPSNYEVTVQWHTLADALIETDAERNLGRCIGLYTRTVQVRERILPEGHDATWGARRGLARALELQGDIAARHGDYASAVASYRQSYYFLSASRDDFDKYRAIDLGNKLVKALETHGEKQEAENLRLRIDKANKALQSGDAVEDLMRRSGLAPSD